MKMSEAMERLQALWPVATVCLECELWYTTDKDGTRNNKISFRAHVMVDAPSSTVFRGRYDSLDDLVADASKSDAPQGKRADEATADLTQVK